MNLSTIEKYLLKKTTWKIAGPSRFKWHSIIKLSRNSILYIIDYKFLKKSSMKLTLSMTYIYYQEFYNTIGCSEK